MRPEAKAPQSQAVDRGAFVSRVRTQFRGVEIGARRAVWHTLIVPGWGIWNKGRAETPQQPPYQRIFRRRADPGSAWSPRKLVSPQCLEGGSTGVWSRMRCRFVIANHPEP